MYELFEAAGVLTGVVVFGSILFSGTAFFFKQYSGINPKKLGRLLDGKEYSEFPA